MKMLRSALAILLLSLVACQTAAGPAGDEPRTLTIYSGRSEDLVGPVLERFEQATGIEVEVKYGDTAEMAALLLEEGDRSPADLFFAQDAGALGAVADAGLLADLPEAVLDLVPAKFRADAGNWIGITGRARVAVFNTDALDPADLPRQILDFTDPRWSRLGWAPTNGSFQAFVTALRLTEGDETARSWLQGIKENGAAAFQNNTAIVEATGRGEVEVGFVNHYYLLRLRQEDPDIAAENYFFPEGGPGALINVAGAGILGTSDRQDSALRFIEFLLSDEGQAYFVEETFEYPLTDAADGPAAAPPLDEVLDLSPEIDLSDIDDLEGTLEMLEDVGLI